MKQSYEGVNWRAYKGVNRRALERAYTEEITLALPTRLI